MVRQRPYDCVREAAVVLDWEFAFSGPPAAGFGSLLRPSPGAAEGFAGPVCEGYRQTVRTLPSDWRRIARIADLLAWAEILSRPHAAATLIGDARGIVRTAIADVVARP